MVIKNMLYCNGNLTNIKSDTDNTIKVMRVVNKQYLPMTANTGDMCITTDTKDCFVFNGVNWVLTGNVSNNATISAGILEKKRCPYCNTIISDEDIHCKSCGAPV